MPVNATGRKYLSELVTGESSYDDNTFTNFKYATVDVEGSTTVDNIGTPLMWSDTDSAFLILAAAADWAATTAYSLGDVVKPTTRDGNEYVAVAAGTSDAAEPSPWNTEVGGETTDATVTWIARRAYSNDLSSPLVTNASICLTVGNEFGKGFNKEGLLLTGTSQSMTVLYRGDATILESGIDWGSVAAADQAEFLTALEAQRITTADEATVVTPAFTS
jgi:hypothetical protein